MPAHVKRSGSWEEVDESRQVKVAGGWADLVSIRAKVSDEWKDIYTAFVPQDRTRNIPGTWTLDVGLANRIYISGRGGDGGGGGGGGGGGSADGTTSSTESGDGGDGGSGNPGNDGADGSMSTLNVGKGGGGGGGEGGEKGENSVVRYGGTTVEEILGGTGGGGGRGGSGGGSSGGANPDQSRVPGGLGGDAQIGHNGSDLSNGGIPGNGGTAPDSIGAFLAEYAGSGGVGGSPGKEGELQSEITHTDIPTNTILTVVVGGVGVGGDFGDRGGRGPGNTSANRGNPGTNGAEGLRGTTGGWVRIRTERSGIASRAVQSLSDFVTTGLTMDVLAFLTVGPTSTTTHRTLFATAASTQESSAIGTLVAGDLELANGSNINRLRWTTSQNLLVVNDSPDAEDLSDYFEDGGPGHDLRLYLQTSTTNVASATIASLISGQSQGGNFVNFILPAAMRTLVNALAEDANLIIGFGRPS